MNEAMTAKEFWKIRFEEYPQNDAEKLSVVMMSEYAKQECDKIFEFSEWASHSDWTYLPSKGLWYNEEDEENITPKTRQQLYDLYTQSKQK